MSHNTQEILWQTWENNALEHLRLVSDPAGLISIKSVAIGLYEGKPFQLHYFVNLTSQFVIQSFEVALDDQFKVSMSHDGDGQWTDQLGSPLPEFNSCIDIDITATPFTNTLPIRRLSLMPGESASISVVYVNVFERRVYPAEQRYTCLSPILYHFEMPSIDFAADIPVDKNGFVLDYPDLFRRLWPNKDVL